MRIALIGAGIVGVTTAYELARDGHQVSVWEQHSAVAEEASFANTGLLSPSLLVPHSHGVWPDSSWLRRLRGPADIRLSRASLSDWRWLRQWGKRVPPATFASRLAGIHKLLQFSQTQLHATTSHLGLNHERSEGLLALLSSPEQAAQWKLRLEQIKAFGCNMKELSPEQARLIEPALAPNLPIHSAVHLLQDEVGNCRQFTQLLRDQAIELGVRFNMDTCVKRISASPQPTLHFADMAEPQSFDQIVVCAGAASQTLLQGLQKKVPLFKLHSYSVSSHLREPLNAPRSGVIDLENQICIVRMGARIRASGHAVMGSPTAAHRAQALKRLCSAMQTSFPGAISLHSAVQVWQGTSTMSPDGLPLLGATAAPGIWLNTGHGPNGWGMACGAARVLADVIAGKPTALPMEAFSPTRFSA
jgi:D-amino-acid dehydrogenase